MSQTVAELADAQIDERVDLYEHLFDADRPKGAWRIQRRDGQYFSGFAGGGTGVVVFVPQADRACGFHTRTAAQHLIDISLGSARGRRDFRDCTPVCLTPLFEAGDHVVCACGQLHEADHCPTANGHGMAL